MESVEVSTVCDGAPYYNVNTPNVSPTTASTSQRVINDTDMNVLNQCSDFAQTLQYIVGDLKQHGYTDREIPAFPKSELLRIMGKNKTKKVLRGAQLDEYLKSKLIEGEGLVGEITPPPSASCTYTLDSLVPWLQSGNAVLNSMKVKSLHSSLNYGLWLDIAYQCFEFSKGAGLVKGTWSNWLKKMLE